MGFKKYGPSRNLFDINATDINNGYDNTGRYLTNTGTTGGNAGGTWRISEYITIEPNSEYRLSGFTTGVNPSYCLYDVNKDFISGTRYGSESVLAITTPSNARYLRFSRNINTDDVTMLNSGSTPLPYEPYGNIWLPITPKKLKGIPYTGTLPATLTGTKAGYLHRYKVYGNSSGGQECGESTANLFDVEPGMLDATNWTIVSTFFMYYLLSEETAEHLKRIGTIAGTVYLIAGGSYYTGEVLAITSSMKLSVTTAERLLQNDGTQLQYSADVSGYSNIYLGIGYGPGITSSNKQLLIDSIFDNYNIMLNAGTVPLSYEPYGYKLPMIVLKNLAPPLSQWGDGYVNTNGNISPVHTMGEKYSDFIKVKPNTRYVLSTEKNAFPQGSNGVWVGIGTYNSEQDFITRRVSNSVNPYTFTTESEAEYVRLSYRTYGELWEPRFSETPFLAQIYIGGDTLSTEEYIDSGIGKIYRMVSGVLTPVDPPMPFPQIPTTAGSTTISWAGSGLAPSQFDSVQEWVDIPTYKYTNGEWVADN